MGPFSRQFQLQSLKPHLSVLLVSMPSEWLQAGHEYGEMESLAYKAKIFIKSMVYFTVHAQLIYWWINRWTAAEGFKFTCEICTYILFKITITCAISLRVRLKSSAEISSLYEATVNQFLKLIYKIWVKNGTLSSLYYKTSKYLVVTRPSLTKLNYTVCFPMRLLQLMILIWVCGSNNISKFPNMILGTTEP